MKYYVHIILWSITLLALATGCGSKSEVPDPNKPGTEQPDPEKPDPEKPNPENPDPGQPEEPPFVPPTISLVGEWGLIEWQNHAELAGKVYARFGSDARFTLYQNVDAQGYTQFRGTYECAWDDHEQAILLTGEYVDGSALGDFYRVEMDASNNRFQLTGLRSGEISIYERTEIPVWVKQTTSTSASRAACTPIF